MYAFTNFHSFLKQVSTLFKDGKLHFWRTNLRTCQSIEYFQKFAIQANCKRMLSAWDISPSKLGSCTSFTSTKTEGKLLQKRSYIFVQMGWVRSNSSKESFKVCESHQQSTFYVSKRITFTIWNVALFNGVLDSSSNGQSYKYI